MSYTLKDWSAQIYEERKFVNAKGNTECVEFIRQAAGAPHTSTWRRGLKVSEARPGQIPRGTAIATFDESGRYPMDVRGKHAAIYLGHDGSKITVLDQWNAQKKVKERPIWFNKPKGTKRSDDGNTYYVIE